ncbi:MAG TPA: MOSC domain-containing protein [Nitrospirae bacterium]|nr:MOSC domain-containing protein [Nitrospirota bacterium]
MNGRVVAINISRYKGVRKGTVETAILRESYGIEGDAHASSEGHRQVSLLSVESIQRMRELGVDVGPGDFAENITTDGIDLRRLPVSARIGVGDTVELEVTQIGKTCHSRCAIYFQAGCCVMPDEGIFARVVRGGTIRIGDGISVRLQGG